MFSHFLVPLDGSRMAEAALPAAAFLAEKFGARVTLMHVIEKNAPREVHGQFHLRDAHEAAAYLDNIATNKFPAGLVVNRHVHETEVENVARSIVAHADELKHDLVIMCSHGRGKALHLFLGSIAQKIVGRDTLPVLITHPDERGEPPTFSCRHILVPLDGDPDHALALPISKQIAIACHASLHLMMVVPHLDTLSGEMVTTGKMLPGTTSRMLEFASQEADEYLDSLLNTLKEQKFSASAHVLRGDPAKMIIDAATNTDIDMIVLGTHGKTGMEAFWAGSVANRICGGCKQPLLLVRV